MEYSPYGESWIDQETDSRALLPFKFTSKELDSETRLYYRGARYLDSQTSRRMSADPAMEDYLPVARNRNRALPGMGGVFNPLNLVVYHYGANNPLKYKISTGILTGYVPLDRNGNPARKWCNNCHWF